MGQVMYASELQRGITQQRSTGEFTQYRIAMQTSPRCPLQEPRGTLSWPVHNTPDKIKLVGPASKLALLERDASHWLSASQRLWPIFIFSRGRPTTAMLNVGASHALGDRSAIAVIVVVSPEEESAYGSAWPTMILAVLPEAGRGIGYARSIIKLAMQSRTPYCWFLDDNIVAFATVRPLGAKVEPYGWWDALMSAQEAASQNGAVLTGFLRANGTEGKKVQPTIVNSMSIYKAFLLHLTECPGINYMPWLACFEDIAFSREILLAGKKTLKLQTFALHAITGKDTGGCSVERKTCAESGGVHLIERGYVASDLTAAELKVLVALQGWLAHNMAKPTPRSLRHATEQRSSSKPPPSNEPPPSNGPASSEQLIGQRIRVWWEGDAKWYAGVISSWDAVTLRHRVVYADGDIVWEKLHGCKWEIY